MAVIHNTTLAPSKLGLLTAWLPSQSWHRGAAEPQLSRAGEFRLDDPAGEVGLELMVVNDASGAEPVSYFTPLAYRGSSLSGAEDHLIGTTEHGVLGRRWIYDGAHAPVVVEQVLAFLRGDVEAQAQNESNTVDATVSRTLSVTGEFVTSDAMRIDSDSAGTVVTGLTSSDRPVTLHVVRGLRAAADDSPPTESIGQIVGNWTTADGQIHRGPFVSLAEN